MTDKDLVTCTKCEIDTYAYICPKCHDWTDLVHRY